MLNAIARALFGTAALNPAFAGPAFAGPAPRIVDTAAPLRLVQTKARTGGERPEGESLDTPLAWADFTRGF